MALPKYNELYAPFLAALMDGNVHALKETKRSIADKLCFSEEERSERLPGGRQAIFDNRMGWARTYLKKAGRIKALQRGYFSITDQGKELLQSGVQITNALLAEHFPTFAEFVGHAEGERRRRSQRLTRRKRIEKPSIGYTMPSTGNWQMNC